jgi:hypothetical protein
VRYYAGLDLAKVEDYTVLVIIDKKRNVVFFDRFHRLDWAVQDRADQRRRPSVTTRRGS